MKKQKIKRETVYGVNMVTIDSEMTKDLQVAIAYNLPVTLDSRYSGIPHLFEHLVFGDILDDCKTGAELLMEASKYNINLNASTSKDKIVFNVTMRSFILPKDAPGYRSIKRFDMGDQPYEVFKDIIAGILKAHAFTNDAIEKEKAIVLSEIEDCRGINTEIYEQLVGTISGSHIIGSVRDIKNASRSLVNDFAMRLPLPSIAIKTDSGKEYFCEIEDDIVDIISRNRNQIPKAGSLPSMETDNLRPVNHRIYDGITDIREISRFLNGLAVIIPSTLGTSMSEVESEYMKEVAIGMILDPFFEGSLGHLLREDLGLIYGFSYAGILKGKYNACLRGYTTSIEKKMDMSSDSQLSSFLNKIDQTICNMVCPSETEYAAILASELVSTFRDANYKGSGLDYALHLAEVNVDKQVTDRILEMPFDFSYEQFTELFDEVKNSISLAIL